MSATRNNRPPKRGLSRVFIAIGLFSLLYSRIFPLYRLSDYIVLACLAYIIKRIFGSSSKDKAKSKDAECDTTQHQEESVPSQEDIKKREEAARCEAERAQAATGDPEVDSMILKGQQMLKQLRSENNRLPDPVISDQIDTVESIANQIFIAVIEQPQKASQIRRFMDYYLPTTLKMLVAYRRIEEGNVTGSAAVEASSRIRKSLDLVIQAFDKQLSRLYEDDALDITTDIDVMETMLRQDGLLDSGLRTRTSTGEEK